MDCKDLFGILTVMHEIDKLEQAVLSHLGLESCQFISR